MKFLVTAGPTIEYIDPVRFISNPSSGKMGYALARTAQKLGHDVLLITGPTHIKKPSKIKTVEVTSAREMKNAVLENIEKKDIVIMTAAVSDFRPLKRSTRKIKKDSTHMMSLPLARNTDILRLLGRRKHSYYLVGFAAETDTIIGNALIKLKEKKLDMIIANKVGGSGSGFATDFNEAYGITQKEEVKEYGLLTKEQLAKKIIQDILFEFNNKVGSR
ncbi:MAG: phosphopantothenoylcysteine decarboxylase [Candidatus Ancaeobacter aquaticus]|nr:phosphopantothenoylcysteine decarboxylase [Candidatus Ancaeobacter aquaticus]